MDNKPKAIVFMLISAFCFAFMGVMVKLAGDIPLFEKVFYRNLISLFVALAIILKSKSKFLGKKENQKYLLIRSLSGLLGVILSFYALNNLVLADASMLNKLSPFFVTLFAFIFLKEKLAPIHVPILIIVLIGAMLIIKPQFDLKMLPALCGFLSAIFAAISYVTLRVLGDKEDYSTIVFYFSLFSVIGIFPIMMFNYKTPSLHQFVYLIGTGLFAAIAQFSLTLAYKNAPASEVSVYDYSNIIFASLLGFVFWRETPDVFSLIGGLLIIISGIVIFIYNNKHKLNNEIK